MDYTEEDLLALIERHDQHEDYYRAQLDELQSKRVADEVEAQIEAALRADS